MYAKIEIIRQMLIDFGDILHHYKTPDNINEMNKDEVMKLFNDRILNNYEACPFDNFRKSGVDSNIRPSISNEYETSSKCRKLDNGIWVGWTYYHGAPETELINWIDDAYILCLLEEKEVTTVQREFKIVEGL